MGEFLTANEIIIKAKESPSDFNFKTRLFIVKHVKKTTKQGKPYLNITLRDTTGEIPNFIKWTSGEKEFIKVLNEFEIGNILEFSAKFDKKYGSSAIINYRILNSTEYDIKDYVESPKIDGSALYDEITKTISKLHNKKLKELLERVFSDEGIKQKFIECPSSIINHHAYKYGNLEHTVGMIKIFEQLIDYYKRNTLLNVDLIYAGIILHDIGKIYEITLNNSLPKRKNDGINYGHIVLGDHLISNFINEIEDFPKDLENKIRHLILSHHGKKEWDSVVEPQIYEAEILHYLDMIDSRFKLNY